MTLNVTDRFDAEAAWAGLPEPVRTAIGAAVLSRHVGGLAVEHANDVDDPVLERAGIAADAAAENELARLLDEIAVPGACLADGRPRIPALLGMVCERCGCSQDDACGLGCAWARDHLCTACAGGADGPR